MIFSTSASKSTSEDGVHYAELAQTATNQDGERSVRSKGPVRLPSRSK